MNAIIAQPKDHAAAILVIDDDANNLAIVSSLLQEYSYTIYVAEDGESGIRRALLTRPDLILLDVLMPGIDGFETCQRLKAVEATRDIPVIFMTALAEMDQKVRGFDAGAVDYIIKPLQREEVLARVGVHIHLRHLAMELQESNASLEKRVEDRTASLASTNDELQKEIAERKLAEEALAVKQEQLEALNLSLEQRVVEEVEKNLQKDRLLFQNTRLAAMGELLNNIAHQWRQPLNKIALLIQGCLYESDEGKLEHESFKSCVNRCMELITYLSNTINSFQSFFMPEGEPGEFNPCETVEKSLALVRNSYEENGISVRIMNDGSVPMMGFRNAFSQAVLSMLNNAQQVLLERGTPQPLIEVDCLYRDGKNIVTISDNGGGIDEKIIGKIFDPYFTTKFKAQGTGLGLYMAKMIIEKNMGGRLSARNTKAGAEFTIELPLPDS
ncbi:hybrid sensor histidine kinase/response regulator [Citrifermentans bremense]|uniref:hybrid sensor histidine kinase/response regulator n=1 Tax=Citrifermentans bremense TaxID=60035 RepID=UPI00041741C4|nr:response regulator [Citrifermentans bremense]